MEASLERAPAMMTLPPPLAFTAATNPSLPIFVLVGSENGTIGQPTALHCFEAPLLTVRASHGREAPGRSHRRILCREEKERRYKRGPGTRHSTNCTRQASSRSTSSG